MIHWYNTCKGTSLSRLNDQAILLDYNTLKGMYQNGAKQILHIFSGLMKDQICSELMNIYQNKHDKEDDYNDIVKLA